MFARSRAQLELVAPLARHAAKHDAMVWTAYPKGGSGAATELHRDQCRDALNATRWDTVSLVAVDEV